MRMGLLVKAVQQQEGSATNNTALQQQDSVRQRVSKHGSLIPSTCMNL